MNENCKDNDKVPYALESMKVKYHTSLCKLILTVTSNTHNILLYCQILLH